MSCWNLSILWLNNEPLWDEKTVWILFLYLAWNWHFQTQTSSLLQKSLPSELGNALQKLPNEMVQSQDEENISVTHLF